MGLKEIRQAVLDVLEANTDISGMFKTYLVEREPKPRELNAIVIKKMGSAEEHKQFPAKADVDSTYTFDIICYMKHEHQEDGDEAQLLSDEYIREAIKKDVTLNCLISWMRPIETTWGRDADNLDIYYTVITVECYTGLNPTDRQGNSG